MKLAYLLGLCVLVFSSCYGCLEARLSLSNKSRLPKWISVSDGKTRKDLDVTMESHSTLTGGKIIFKVFDKGSFFPIFQYEIKSEMQSNMRPIHIELPREKLTSEKYPKEFPKYLPITVHGIIDVIEQRKMEPIFYMTDDPAVWEALGVKMQQ